MSDLNPDTPAPPTVVDANPLGAQVASLAKDAGVLLGFGTALAGFASHRDAAGALAYLQSSAALPAIGMLVGIGTVAYRQWTVRRTRAVTVQAALSPANTTVIVKGQ